MLLPVLVFSLHLGMFGSTAFVSGLIILGSYSVPALSVLGPLWECASFSEFMHIWFWFTIDRVKKQDINSKMSGETIALCSCRLFNSMLSPLPRGLHWPTWFLVVSKSWPELHQVQIIFSLIRLGRFPSRLALLGPGVNMSNIWVDASRLSISSCVDVS